MPALLHEQEVTAKLAGSLDGAQGQVDKVSSHPPAGRLAAPAPAAPRLRRAVTGCQLAAHICTTPERNACDR